MEDTDILSKVCDDQLISSDENEVYKLVKSYMDRGDKSFGFTPAEVLFCENEYIYGMKMVKHC